MATKKPKGLGRGLEALLESPTSMTQSEAPSDGAVTKVLPLDSLVAGVYQPRTRMDEGALYELAQSIKSQGIMQPILVRLLPKPAPAGSGPQYEIIAGERRYRAARLAGLTEVPALIRDVPDESAALMALIENIQREELNPLEEAQALMRLINEFGRTHEQAALAIGRSRSAATNLLRLLELAEPVKTMLMAGDLDMGHARALLALEGALQITTANQIVARKLSVRQAESLVKRVSSHSEISASRKKISASKQAKSGDLKRIEEQLSDSLAAAVQVRVKKMTSQGLIRSGELAIGFGSLDELDGLIERLGAA